jgi:putative two-component system response regulator
MITPSAPSARILAADDDESALRVLNRILSRGGFGEVRTTTDGTCVEALFREFRPDMVLLDLHMGAIQAPEVIRRLRALIPPEEHVPILVVSGDLSDESRLAVLSEGAADFINKPYSAGEVMLRVRNHLQTRLLHTAVREQNRTLEARVRERTEALERTAGEVLERLARAAELRDDDTGLHTRRVAELAGDLARAMGLPEEQVQALRLAATLHDIGKIGIPDAVLLKPGRLTPEEWEVMKSHTVIGARILAEGSSEVIRLAEHIARSHHERWDGGGYPMGLAGTDIPLPARIVALADVYDALTSDRPYRAAWSVPRVLEEIRSLRGTHFDPAVVDAFMDAVVPSLHAREAA